jgi:hypothetical protein
LSNQEIKKEDIIVGSLLLILLRFIGAKQRKPHGPIAEDRFDKIRQTMTRMSGI